MNEQLVNRLHRAIAEGVFPGCVVGVFSSKGRDIVACGSFMYDVGAPSVNTQSIFDVASLTKAIPCSSLALQLVDQGKLDLDEPVRRFVPEFVAKHAELATIRHLLTQTLDFGYPLSTLKDLSPESILETIFIKEMRSPPGSVFSYSNATSILLGLVVERVCGQTLEHSATSSFFSPLGMVDTGFSSRSLERTVPTEIDPWRGRMVRGEVHDESAYALRPRIVGSAGLFSTVPDLLTFLEMLLNGGALKGRRFFTSDILVQMHSNQITALGGRTGLGWELRQERFMGRLCSPLTLGKTGFTGCMCLVDFQSRVGVVMLSNWTFPTRKSDNAAINAVRSDIADIILAEYQK